MSKTAEQIAEAHRMYKAAIGTERELAAYRYLEAIVAQAKNRRVHG